MIKILNILKYLFQNFPRIFRLNIGQCGGCESFNMFRPILFGLELIIVVIFKTGFGMS